MNSNSSSNSNQEQCYYQNYDKDSVLRWQDVINKT